jgi:ketosteroid isomerase-like protein
MAERFVDRLRRAYDAFNREGVEGFIDLLDPGVVWIPQEGSPSNPYVGHEGVRRWYRSLLPLFDVIHFDPRELTEVGDRRILAVLNLHFRATGSGVEMDIPYANVWTLNEDGRAVRIEMYADVAKARAAVA